MSGSRRYSRRRVPVGRPPVHQKWDGGTYTHGTPSKKPKPLSPTAGIIAPFGASTVCLVLGHASRNATGMQCRRCLKPVSG